MKKVAKRIFRVRKSEKESPEKPIGGQANEKTREALMQVEAWLLFSYVVSTPLDDRDHTAQRFLLTQLH
jgi:hypothetical protein